MSIKKRILSVLFWSIVSAAFIGPGTVTIATKAGVYHNFSLLWALLFSTFATILLQEASARLAIETKLNLGEAIAKYFEGKSTKMFALLIIVVAIIVGCAAYEAGNILGAVAGLTLIFDIPSYVFVAGIGFFAILVFSIGSVYTIARFMGFVVFLMGVAFFTTSISLNPDWGEVVKGAFIPVIPDAPGAGLLVLGLVGTTVIPYDLFLGSGALDKKQTIREMRFGLSIAIILGGIISMSIMGVGNAITERMSETARANVVYNYDLLKDVLELYVGKFAIYIFGFGMFAAGFSSAVTAPLASAITARSLFSNKSNAEKWTAKSLYFKLVIAGVLGTGLLFGFLDVKPIPAIIIAQAFNGLILPLIAVFLIYVINDTRIMGHSHLNGWVSNVLMCIVLWVTLLLGFTSIAKSVASTFGFDLGATNKLLFIPVIIISFVISGSMLVAIIRKRIKNPKPQP